MCANVQPYCALLRVVNSVRFVGGLGVNPPLVDDDPPLVTAKSGLGVEFDPPQKGQKSKFVIKSL